MRRDPPLDCPMCDECRRFTRAGLVNHLVRHHHARRSGALIVASGTAKYARWLAMSVSRPVLKFPANPVTPTAYGADAPAWVGARLSWFDDGQEGCHVG